MKPGLFGGTPELRAYQPTLRDRAAAGLMNMLGNPNQNSALGHLVGGIMGSYGAGSTGQFSLADLMPFFQADEAGRQIANGHPVAGGAGLALALPIPAGKVAQAAGQAAKGLVGSAARKAVQDAAQLAAADGAKAAAPIVAYHGSPYQFDKFDASKIGTGEGAQSYGHGLYFAENEAVAQQYRDQLARGPRYQVNGVPEQNAGTRAVLQDIDAAGGLNNPQKLAELAKSYRQMGRDSWARFADDLATGAQTADRFRPGATYQVGINAHPDHFLDWDKPLSEQPHILASTGLPTDDSGRVALPNGERAAPEQLRGSQLWHSYVEGNPSAGPAGATQQMQQAGIPGIKYLDQGSRGAGDGTRNYVVFDPAHIDILKRYGIPVTAFGGLGAAALGGQINDGSDQ